MQHEIFISQNFEPQLFISKKIKPPASTPGSLLTRERKVMRHCVALEYKVVPVEWTVMQQFGHAFRK